MTERQRKRLKPGDYQLIKLRHQNTYRHMKYSGLQNVTLQNFAKKGQHTVEAAEDEKQIHIESKQYLDQKFDIEKRSDIKRDSLFQHSDDTATQMNDPFKTGEQFFSIGNQKDLRLPEAQISRRGDQESKIKKEQNSTMKLRISTESMNKKNKNVEMSVIKAKNFGFEECEEVSELNPSRMKKYGISTRMKTTGMGMTGKSFGPAKTQTDKYNSVSSAIGHQQRPQRDGPPRNEKYKMNKTFQVPKKSDIKVEQDEQLALKEDKEAKKQLYDRLQSVMKEEGEIKRELYQKLQQNQTGDISATDYESIMGTSFQIAPKDILNHSLHTDRRSFKARASTVRNDPLLEQHSSWLPISKEYERRIKKKESKLRSFVQDQNLFRIERQCFKDEAEMFKQHTKTNR